MRDEDLLCILVEGCETNSGGRECTTTAPSRMFQGAKIAEVAQGISSFQTLCQANKVCQTLTKTVGKTELREKKNSSMSPSRLSIEI